MATAETIDAKAGADGPGKNPVGAIGIIVSLVLLLTFSILLLATLVSVWPRTSAGVSTGNFGPGVFVDSAGRLSCAPRDTTHKDSTRRDTARRDSTRRDSARRDSTRLDTLTSRPAPVPAVDTTHVAECVDVWSQARPFWIEHRVFLITILAGMLGATVHALRSLVWYVGNRQLVWSWLATYLSLPIVGGLLAAVFYVVVRGGLFSLQVTNQFGFAAMGALIGMFTTPAALKLKEIAETLLTRGAEGANAVPQPSGATTPPGGATGGAPTITTVERQRRSAGAAREALLLKGSGFAATTTALVNSQPRAVEFQTSLALLLPLTDEDLKRIDAGGDFVIVVTNPGGVASKPFEFHSTSP
jgi:hypothetical protein